MGQAELGQLSKNLNQRVFSGILWKLLENGGDQLITFVISLVLARLLGPEKYGTMSLMLIFVAIGNVIVQSGFQTALIQKKDVDRRDFSSVFWLTLCAAALLYALIFAAAPLCGEFFGDPAITPMLRALSLILFFGAVTSLETAILARKLEFRKQCLATVLADILSGAIGIAAALLGAGTWALVWQQLFKNLFLAGFLFIWVGWRPALLCDTGRLAGLFSYGWKLLCSSLIDTIWTNLYTPVISKLYNPLYTGYYSRGNQFPQVIANAAAQTLQSVMLPAYASVQDEKESLKGMLRKTLRLGSFLMFPAMFGLAAVSEPLLRVLLGEIWTGAAPYLSLCAIGYSVWPMHVANLQAINAVGRSDLYLRLEVIKKLLGIAVLLCSVRFGILPMIFLKSLTDFACTVINAWPNRRLCDYGPLRQWRDVLPELVTALVMGALVSLVPHAFGGIEAALTDAGSALLCLITQILLGVLIYGGIALCFRLEGLRELKQAFSLIRNRSARGND